MESGTKLLGHPIYPMRFVFPFGLLTTAMIFNALYLSTTNPVFLAVYFHVIAVGVIGGSLAAIFGFIDWLAVPNNSYARYLGRWLGRRPRSKRTGKSMDMSDTLRCGF
jgi:uncharacterized membrane protein